MNCQGGNNYGCGCGCSCNSAPNPYQCFTPNSLCMVPIPAALKGNFTVPAAGETVTLSVTSSFYMYVGQGIQIGDGYYQITAINSSTSITVTPSFGATEGDVLIARNPYSGCYNYPIIYVGMVEQEYEPEVTAYDSDEEAVSGISGVTIGTARYGYVGPGQVYLEVSVSGTVANAPVYIGIELPKNRNSFTTTMNATYVDTAHSIAIADWKTGDESIVLISKSGQAAFSNVASSFLVGGIYKAVV